MTHGLLIFLILTFKSDKYELEQLRLYHKIFLLFTFSTVILIFATTEPLVDSPVSSPDAITYYKLSDL